MRCRCGHDAGLHRCNDGQCLVCTCAAFVLNELPATEFDRLQPDEADLLRAFVAAVLSRGREDELTS